MWRLLFRYASILALGLLLLKLLSARLFALEMKVEIYLAVIAIFFLGLGVYGGIRLGRPKAQSKIKPKKQTEPEEVPILAERLSPREREVLQCLAAGCRNQEIADQLHISLPTVKTHLNRIYQKLEVSNRTQALLKAHEYKLVSK